MQAQAKPLRLRPQRFFAFPGKARLDVAQPARAIPCGKIAGFRARADKPADAWHGG